MQDCDISIIEACSLMQLLLMHSEIVIAPIWRDKNMMLAVGKWFAIS
jgi:hypothetical protein